MPKIKLLHDYRGDRTGLLRAGEYDAAELNGAAQYLLENGHAVLIEEEAQPKAVEPVEIPAPRLTRRKS